MAAAGGIPPPPRCVPDMTEPDSTPAPAPTAPHRSRVSLLWCRVCTRVSGVTLPHPTPDRADMLLLRWGVLSVVVLLTTMLLLLSGCFEGADEAQLRLLCGNPFYLEAEATQHMALSPAGMFGWCVAVTLYLSIVLLLRRRFAERLQIALMAAVAVALPGLLCVLWDCVFYVAPLVFCVIFTWALVVTVPFFRRSRS